MVKLEKIHASFTIKFDGIWDAHYHDTPMILQLAVINFFSCSPITWYEKMRDGQVAKIMA